MYASAKTTKVVMKMNASKHESQIQLSPKPLGFSKIALTKSFLEFYLDYNRFYLKLPRPILQNLQIAIFWQLGLKLGVFPFLIHLKIVFENNFSRV